MCDWVCAGEKRGLGAEGGLKYGQEAFGKMEEEREKQQKLLKKTAEETAQGFFEEGYN